MCRRVVLFELVDLAIAGLLLGREGVNDPAGQNNSENKNAIKCFIMLLADVCLC